MAQGNDLRPARGSWGHVAKLVRVLDMRLGPGALGQLHHELARRPYRERPMPLPDLDHASGEWRGRRQAIQHAIVGQVAIPTDFALFGGKAFPGKRLGQGRKRFLLAALAGAFMGRAMHAGIDAFAPGCRLVTLVLAIGEGDAWPEILCDKADRALDFPFRLWGKRLTDAWRDPNGGHEEGLAGVPA